jgi:thiamine-monophosphate kinase
MNEFELIARLTQSLPTNASTVLGPGDDCAILDLGVPDRWLLFKTDAIVEGIHFDATAPPDQIGHKALARCLSDFAAMAGTPTHALVTLALPTDFDVNRVEAIYCGLNALAARHQVAVVGGETTTNPERMLISISVLEQWRRTNAFFVPAPRRATPSSSRANSAVRWPASTSISNRV